MCITLLQSDIFNSGWFYFKLIIIAADHILNMSLIFCVENFHQKSNYESPTSLPMLLADIDQLQIYQYWHNCFPICSNIKTFFSF